MNAKFWLLLAALSPILLTSCEKEFNTKLSPFGSEGKGAASPKIAVISDIHYMSPVLFSNNGANGAAFQSYTDQDPKLVQYSDPIFRSVLEDLKREKPDIILIPGDITKDGEKICHQAMAGFFQQLRHMGMQVFVVPGNHDINNAKAKRFDGDNAIPVDMTSADQFASIYGDFGYNKAIARDPNSLSYVAQLKPFLRLIAIDASKYEEYGPAGDVAAGRIKPQTLTWLLAQLEEARKKHIRVFGMMHHNLVEHYAGQATLDPGYVIEDWENVANKLLDAGMNIIFTGHYHANDITPYSHNGKTLFDIETGSLVTAPCPYRYVELQSTRLDISTKTVQSVNTTLPGGMAFQPFASLFLSQHLDGYFNYYLAKNLGAPAALASFAAPIFRDGIMAHFAGDENLTPAQQGKINDLSALSPQLAGIVTTLWTDLGEKDNTNTTVTYQ